MRVMASVRPVRSGSAANIAHFGATTETVRLRVHHQVSADVLDTAVHVGHTATVVAQLKPAESDQPAFLQRRTRSGDWRVVATRATDADGSVRLTLASARKGWQVLRVRVPRDASHSAGTSAQLRVLGY